MNNWDRLARAIELALPADRDRLREEVEGLPEEERVVLELRFGLVDGLERGTLQQVADRFGVTRERVRQVEARALRMLRRAR